MTRLQRTISEHPRHALAAAVAAGLALGPASADVVVVAALAAALILLACDAHGSVAVAACALLIGAAALGGMRLAAIDSDPMARSGGWIETRGIVVAHPRASATGTTLRVRARVGRASQLVELRTRAAPPPGLAIGSELVVRGVVKRVSAAAARSPQAASYAGYLLRSGVRRRVEMRGAIELTGARRGGALGLVDGVRERTEAALAIGLAPEPAALLRGMILGGDSGIPEATVEDFRVAGLAHILAVSGQNVLLIVILVDAIAVALGAGHRTRIWVPAALIAVYVLLCGAQASVLRAGAMGLAGLAAIAASRPGSRVYALLLAAVFVLAWNPRATADVGAQLSFAAVIGMMAFTRPLAERLESRFASMPRWTLDAFAATAGATLATAPLMALHFGTLSIVSLAANVIGEPLIGPIVWLGSLTAAAAQVSQPLAAVLNAPNGFLLGALIEVAHAAAAIPGAQVAMPEFGLTGVGLAFALIGFAAAIVNGWMRLPRVPSRREIAVACGSVVAALAVFVLARPARTLEIPRPAIVMLDVGQGDATLLLGAGGCNALIDGGPPGDQLEAKLAHFGVERLDLALATHPENDHYGGILEIARAGRPRVTALFDGGGNTRNQPFLEARSLLRREGATSADAVEGAEWRCGDLAISVIGPPASAPGAPPPANPNTRAAVTLVRVGRMTMFASGDAESPQLLPLPLPRADILKTPHHGSADPGLPQVLARVRPRLALIGVGADNRFGHPVPATLAAIEATGARVYRTDRDGTIVVTQAAAGGPAVSTVRIDR